MKRALVLGASALIILALNQNTVREVSLQSGPEVEGESLNLKDILCQI